ncbi:Ig-like domain-containing protein, partial [Candidatus Poribacteria bacterium]
MMKRISISVAVTASLLVALQLLMSFPVLAAKEDKRSKVIIGYHTPPGKQQEDKIRVKGGAVKYRYKLISAIAAEASEAAIRELKKDKNVKYVEPDYEIQIAGTIPNDPGFDDLWGLHNTGQIIGTPDVDIDAPEAWDIETGDSNLVIAVIDTGVDYNHEDLSANMWTNPGEIPDNGIDDDNNGYVDDYYGWDFCNSDNDPMDDYGHGTHCSGTIAAVGDNGIGVTGINWQARIMALKFIRSDGYGSTSDAIAAVQYATSMKQDFGIPVIATSNSWGGPDSSQALVDAIAESDAAEILFVAAAGNDGQNNDIIPFYPANHDVPNVISVAATDYFDDLAWFSNYGAISVDLAAPGVDILSTIPGNNYQYNDGTSMATPHVSGVVGLVKAQFPTITHLQIRDRILGSVNIVPGLQGSSVTGGRLNAWNALDTDAIPPAEVTDLTSSGSAPISVTLTWTATGDDGLAGAASSYDVRYSTSLISEANWYIATQAVNEPGPKPSGFTETFNVLGLFSDTTYYFALKVKDNVGNESDLSNVIQASTGPDTIPPVVTITSPLPDSEVSWIIGIAADVSDNAGVEWISDVEFYADGVLVGNDTIAPYFSAWDTRTVEDGSHTIEVKAYDLGGNIGVDQISVVVINADMTPPTVTITGPLPGSEVSGTITIATTVSDNTGVEGITNVEFYVDGALSGNDTTHPFSYSWDTTTVSDGSRTIEAKAYDEAENMGTDQVSVMVNNVDTIPPTVTITTPAAGSEVSGTTTVVASVSDNNGVAAITNVDFYMGGVLKGSDTAYPFSCSWDTTTASDGSCTVEAKAYDEAGNMGAGQISVTVNNADTIPPTVSITYPFAGSSVSGTTAVATSVSDNNGITGIANVEFYIDGVLSGNDTTYIFSWSWNTTTVPNGSRTIEAKVYDTAGNMGTAQISVTVNNPDNITPTVTITSPASGSEVSDTVAISADASDNMGVEKVEFYVDTVLLANDTTAPYSCSWDTTSATNGSHTIEARAYDVAGNMGVNQISVTVNNPDTIPPTVTITSPASGSEVSGAVTISADASDDV